MDNRRTIRGIDDEAWEMLVEVREINEASTGALVSEALRLWYEQLPVTECPSAVAERRAAYARALASSLFPVNR